MALIPTNSVGGFSTGLTMTNVIDSAGNISGVAGTFTGTLAGATGSFSKLLTASAGLSASGGATFSGTFSGATASFSKLLTASAGLSASALTVGGGATFAAISAFTAGLTARNLYVSGGATFAGADTVAFTTGLSADSVYATALYVSGGIFPRGASTTLNLNYNGNSITNIGDVNNDNNNTNIQVDDSTGTITLSAPVGGINNSGGFLSQVSAPSFADTYSFVQTYQTTTTATTANQTIATILGVYDNSVIPPVMGYPAFEVTISARDTVLNKTEMLKMLVVQDGTNTVNTQYGLIRTGATGPVSSYSTTLSGTPRDLLIRATPLSANSTVFTTTVRAQLNG